MARVTPAGYTRNKFLIKDMALLAGRFRRQVSQHITVLFLLLCCSWCPGRMVVDRPGLVYFNNRLSEINLFD